MASRQEIIWTAVPNGTFTDAAGQRFLRLSVFVSPRLSTLFVPPQPAPALMRLGDFRDFRDWPETVRQIRFSVVFRDGPLVDFDTGTGVRRREPAPPRDTNGDEVANVWRELFDDNTPVVPYEFDDDDPAQKGTISYQVSEVSRFVENSYLNLAQQPPPADPAEASLSSATLHEALASEVNASASLENVEQFNQALLTPAATPARDSLDFHELVSSLGEYPELLRSLALVVDLEVPLTPGIRLEDNVRVEAEWLPRLPRLNAGGQVLETTFNEQPWTRYTLDPDAGAFRPATRPDETDYLNGMLHLGHRENFQFVFHREPFDTHAQAIKLRAFARNNPQTNGRALPPLRSAGIAISRSGLRDRLTAEFASASANNAQVRDGRTNDVTLFAEDLVRGYRVDVSDVADPDLWRSLCRRRGTYTLLRNNRQLLLEDEGWVTHGVVQTAGEQANDPDRLAIHETLFRWEGWSLCAPRPGRALLPDEQLGEGDAGSNPVIRTAFTVPPRTLPRLRFGRSYSMRARVVDLIGNSLAPDDEGDALALDVLTEPIRYGRFEPAPAPVVVLRDPLTDEQDRPLPGKQGESFECLVVRSNFDAPAASESRRHLVPHKTSQALAEAHGLPFFETAVGLRPETYDEITRLDGVLATVHDTDRLELPYLPDPISTGLLLYGLPDRPADQPLALDFYPPGVEWPRAKPWRVDLVGGEVPGVRTTAPDPATGAEGLLTIVLPKAEVVTLRLMSRLTEENLNLLALWHRLEASIQDAATREQFRRGILNGSLMMVTPQREVRLVHAVQQPLFKPELQMPAGGGEPLTHTRRPGDTSARLSGNLRVPAKSAGKLEMLAAWTEPRDTGAPGTVPDVVNPTAQVFQIDLPAPEGASAEDFTRPLDRLPGDPPGEFVSPVQEFGDTKHRNVTYTFVATSRFTEFFPPETSGFTRESDPFTLNVRNSARPPVPQVEQVLPTFGWPDERMEQLTETPAGGGPPVVTVRRTRRRLGNSVRVYLKRPWFVTGEGEMLGVVVARDPVDVPLSLHPHVTRIGDDPTVRLQPSANGSDVAFYPEASRFTSAVNVLRRMRLEEAGGAEVDVAAHRVEFDAGRGLWYCDVVINPDRLVPTSYFPFVRLMLVRVQPSSLDGLQLSPLVPADFVQLAPPREASISQSLQNFDEIRVRVGGYFPPADEAHDVNYRVTVSVERPRQFVEGDLKWQPTEIDDLPLTPSGEAHNRRWTGTIMLPPNAGNVRIMVKEYEIIPSDDPERPAERLVYADAFVR